MFALAVVIGTTMGGGIFYTPGQIAALLPNAWLYMAVWVFGGICAWLGATVFAELGGMIPLSGGPYSFARRALGEYAGSFVGYTQWVLDCAGNAALLLLIGEYSYVLVPPFAGHAVAVAFATLIILTVLNWRSVHEGSRIQVVTTVAKTLALGAVVGSAFLLPHPAVAYASPLPLPRGTALVAALALAMQSVIFAYDAYYFPIFFGEELRDPGREIPRAIFSGLAVTMVMFLLLNAAFLWVLPIARMANEPFVGGAVAQALFGVHGDRLIRSIVIVSVLGIINAVVLATARMLLAMGRDAYSHTTRLASMPAVLPPWRCCLVPLQPACSFSLGRSVRCLGCLPCCWGESPADVRLPDCAAAARTERTASVPGLGLSMDHRGRDLHRSGPHRRVCAERSA